MMTDEEIRLVADMADGPAAYLARTVLALRVENGALANAFNAKRREAAFFLAQAEANRANAESISATLARMVGYVAHNPGCMALERGVRDDAGRFSRYACTCGLDDAQTGAKPAKAPAQADQTADYVSALSTLEAVARYATVTTEALAAAQAALKEATAAADHERAAATHWLAIGQKAGGELQSVYRRLAAIEPMVPGVMPTCFFCGDVLRSHHPGCIWKEARKQAPQEEGEE